VPQIVEVKVFDPEELTGSRPRGTDRVGREREYPVVHARHAFDDRGRLGRQIAPRIVADLSPGCFMLRTSTRVWS